LSVGLAGGLIATHTLQGQDAAPAAIPKELTSYRNIVKRVLPAVVSIESRIKQPRAKNMNQPRNRRTPRFDDSQVPEEFRRFFHEFQVPFDQMPEPGPTVGFGSGFLVDPKGVILTNFHVVGGATEVEVTLADGRKFMSRDIKGDRKTDLAIVRIQSKETLPFLEVGDSDAMEIGDRVLAVGAPFGLTGTVTHGIVSGKGRNGFHMNMYEDFIQTDAAINPGNSGGPLVNLAGQVIGINAAIKSRTGGFQGVGLAISANLAKNVMKQLEEQGVVHRGYLGVQIKPLDPEVAARLGVQEKHGVLVGEVFDGSPAAKAGLKPGDVITAVAGKPVKDARALQHLVVTLPLNKPTEVAVVRDGKELSKRVTIEEQPEEFGVASAPVAPTPRGSRDAVNMDKVGLEVTDLTPERADQLGFGSKVEGALITHVNNDSPAADAGLRRGMVITKVDKKRVADAEAFRSAIDKSDMSKGVLLQVRSPRGGTDYVMLKGS
jgi:serine protease Do